MNTDEKSSEILNILEKAGYEAYLVGGCVRDLIIGRTFNDTDMGRYPR